MLLTGGTGTIGKALLSEILQLKKPPKQLIILSRDEYKQYQLNKHFALDQHPFVTFTLTDVQDYPTLAEEFQDVDLVIHAAALKRVDSGEHHPDAFVATNIMGTKNVMAAAKAQRVDQVITISTDKAVYPTTLYGATKLCAERIAIQKNNSCKLLSSVIRLGNILGSRGSIVTELLDKDDHALIQLTHPEMTRFTMTATEGARYILKVIDQARGGEIFIPKMDVYRLIDLVSVIAPTAEIQFTEPRYTEKIHENLLSHEEARFTLEGEHEYVISLLETVRKHYQQHAYQIVPHTFEYHSNQNSFLSRQSLEQLLQPLV